MASTKFDVASAALVMIGANPVSSFDSPTTVEEIVCRNLYQSTLNEYLSLYPWRFATKTTQLSLVGAAPDTQWQKKYTEPSDAKAIQGIIWNDGEVYQPFDRFENHIYCNAGDGTRVYAVHTYEPAVSRWPGYFVALMQVALAAAFCIPVTSKVDLQQGLEKVTQTKFMLAKNADSRQQTTRRLKVAGRGSIMQARRS